MSLGSSVSSSSGRGTEPSIECAHRSVSLEPFLMETESAFNLTHNLASAFMPSDNITCVWEISQLMVMV